MLRVWPEFTTARMAPWTKKIVDIVWDGEWHPWDAVVVEAAALVPPGQAFRHTERDRQRLTESTERKRGDSQTAIQTGQRRIAVDAIIGLRARDRIETKEDDDGSRWIRLKLVEPEGVLMVEPEPRPTTNGSTPRAPKPQVGDAPALSTQRGPRIIVYPTSDGKNVHEVQCDICRFTGFVSSQEEAILALAEHVKEQHPTVFRSVATFLARGPVGNSQLALDNVQRTR